MSKYCKPMGLYVTYLDCMDCEDKECIQSHKKDKKESDKMLASIICEPNDIVYLVFCSKKHGARENIIFKARVEMVTITTEGIRYHAYCLKCVNNKKVDKELQEGKWINNYCFGNQTIDNGYRNDAKNLYPVFTTKERCLEWLKS